MGLRSNYIPEQYRGIKRYSFSELSNFKQCRWSYFLGRMQEDRIEQEDNIYSLAGGLAHDIIEHEDEYDYDGQKMKKKFIDDFNGFINSGFRFSNDDERNESMMASYKTNIKHYFDHYYKDEVDDVEKEYRIWTYIKDKLISGFVDCKYIKNGAYEIRDYKTSTMYAKAKMNEASAQLVIYAKDLIDKGVPIENINICWDFLKYTRIWALVPVKRKVEIQPHEYDDLIARGIIKTKRSKSYETIELEMTDLQSERKDVAVKFRKPLSKILEFEGLTEDEIQKILDEFDGNISTIPQYIVDKYEINFNKCVVYAPLTEGVLQATEDSLYDTILEIEELVNTKGDKEETWEREYRIQDSESFYCSVLCGLNQSCKYYKDMMDSKEAFIKEEHRQPHNSLRGDMNSIDSFDLLDALNKDMKKSNSLDDIDLSDLI